jgi:nicotinamide riboside transporter PnuC
MIDTIIQIAIFIFSALAIILVARKNKWGFVIGLLSQPFWFITSYQNKHWGIFFVSIIYTFSWVYGIYEWFYNKK